MLILSASIKPKEASSGLSLHQTQQNLHRSQPPPPLEDESTATDLSLSPIEATSDLSLTSKRTKKIQEKYHVIRPIQSLRSCTKNFIIGE